MEEEKLKFDAEALIYQCNNYDKAVRDFGLQDSQWFIDWQDALNEISVR